VSPPHSQLTRARDTTASDEQELSLEDYHRSALSFSSFRIYFVGSVLAMNALRLGALAQGLLMWELTGSTLSLGSLAAAVAIPMMVVNVFGGVFADRYEARFLLGSSSLIGALLLVILGVLYMTNTVEPWHVFTVAIFSGLVAGADQPSRQSFFPSLVPKSAVKSAVTINGSLLASASVIAPTFGGILIAVTGLHIGFFVAALGWVAMLISTLFLPDRGIFSNTRSVISDLWIGFGFIKANRVILVLTLLAFSNMLMGFGWIAILPAYVDRFDGGAQEVGYMFSSAGVGALTGIIVSGSLSAGRFQGLVILAAAAAFSLIMLFVSYSEFLFLSMVLAAFAHFGNGLFNISSLVAVQIRVPENIRGRVMGVYAISQSIGVLGGLWAGFFADTFGIRVGMMVGPLILLVMILVITLTQSSVRNLHENP
tara:strand:+ start:598 stop:1875 length:1278 start_codon:yes stop_codon:yes gene_type:complete